MRYLQMIQDKLAGSEWEVREGNREGMVETLADGAVICVDGRPPKGEYEDQVVRGPKIQGGVEGIALLRAKKEGKEVLGEEDFLSACDAVIKSGYVPGVHDLGHDPVHCGHCKLLMQGYFEGLPGLNVKPARMVEIVEDKGGVHVELEGEHVEEKVIVNFVSNMTFVPSYKSFILDAWYAEKVGVVLGDLLVNAVSTVEGLNGPKIIEVVE